MAKHKDGQWWPEEKKIEVVTSYLVLGKSPLVAAVCGIPEGTVRQWKTQPWWNELVHQIQTESDQELDAKLAKRIDKALDIINDRLENGDFQYDPRTGEFIRKPVSMRDTWKMSNEMLDKRWIIRKQPKDQSSQEAVGDILKNLAVQFADMAKKQVKEALDVAKSGTSELQDGVQELSRNSSSETQSSGEKSS